MSFARTITHESRTTPGVSFTVRRMGLGSRTDLDFQTLAHRQRLRELESDYPPPSDREGELAAQLEIAKKKALAVPADQFEAVIESDVKPLGAELAAAIPADVKRKRAVLDEEYVQVDARIRAAWIRAGLIAITGGELDGMTADELLDYGPPELAQEIYGVLVGDGRLRGADSKNSASGTTSGEQVDGASPNSTVEPVEVLGTLSTWAATASSTSPAT